MRPPEEDDSKALHEMNPTGRFSVRAGDYARFRPDYPAAAIDAVLEGLGVPESLAVADVGAGTGISAREIADRGARVIALEPNAAMRAAATPHPRVAWGEGTAEASGLASASVNVVLCAQAFHWFRPAEAIAEFQRVLRPGGRLALIWNKRDHGDALTRGYIEAIRAVGGEHPAETRPFDGAIVSAAGRFTPVTHASFPHEQGLDAEGFVGRATSASYVSLEPAALEDLRALLLELFERHRDALGRVTMRYRTEVFRAERRPLDSGARSGSV